MTGPTSDEDAKLAALRERYPRWSIWKGRHTGRWWAMPRRPLTALVDAPDLDQLAAKIADVEAWEPGD
jgi:hypothetical protein